MPSVLVADSDEDDEDASFGGAAGSVRESNPASFAGAQSGSDTSSSARGVAMELDDAAEEQLRAAWVAKSKRPAQLPPQASTAAPSQSSSTAPSQAKRRRRVEIVSPAMQAAQAASAPPPSMGAATEAPPPVREDGPARRPAFTERAIGGVRIAFPAGLKPHAPQVAVMAKVVTALRLKKHALLEAPTGTGKSLALLSAALAWQSAEAPGGQLGPRIQTYIYTHTICIYIYTIWGS